MHSSTKYSIIPAYSVTGSYLSNIWGREE